MEKTGIKGYNSTDVNGVTSAYVNNDFTHTASVCLLVNWGRGSVLSLADKCKAH